MARRNSKCLVLLITIFSIGILAGTYCSGFYERGIINKNNPFTYHKLKVTNEQISVEQAKALAPNTEVLIKAVVSSSNEFDSYLADRNTGVGILVKGLGSLKIQDELVISGTLVEDEVSKVKYIINAKEENISHTANVAISAQELDFNKKPTLDIVHNVVNISNVTYVSAKDNVFTFAKDGENFPIMLMDKTALKDEIAYLRKFSNGFSKIKVDKIQAIVGYNNSQYQLHLRLGNSMEIDYLNAVLQSLSLKHNEEPGYCKTQFYIAREYVLSLDQYDLATFKSSNVPNIKEARERYETWARILKEDAYSRNSLLKENIIQYDYSGMIIVIIASSVMIASGYGLFLLVRRRKNKAE